MSTGIRLPADRWTTIDVLNGRRVAKRLVGHLLERDDLAAPITTVRGDEQDGLRVVDAIAQRLRAESAEDHAVHGADPGAREHRNRELRHHRHVERHAIAALHAKRLEHVGERTDLLIQVPVRERPAIAGLAFPDERGLVATRRTNVPVDAVRRDIQLSVDEPLRVGRFPFEHARPGLDPVQLAGELGPEGLRIRGGAPVHVGIVHRRRAPPLRRGRKATVFLQERIDLSHKPLTTQNPRIRSDGRQGTRAARRRRGIRRHHIKAAVTGLARPSSRLPDP